MFECVVSLCNVLYLGVFYFFIFIFLFFCIFLEARQTVFVFILVILSVPDSIAHNSIINNLTLVSWNVKGLVLLKGVATSHISNH